MEGLAPGEEISEEFILRGEFMLEYLRLFSNSALSLSLSFEFEGEILEDFLFEFLEVEEDSFLEFLLVDADNSSFLAFFRILINVLAFR